MALVRQKDAAAAAHVDRRLVVHLNRVAHQPQIIQIQLYQLFAAVPLVEIQLPNQRYLSLCIDGRNLVFIIVDIENPVLTRFHQMTVPAAASYGIVKLCKRCAVDNGIIVRIEGQLCSVCRHSADEKRISKNV